VKIWSHIGILLIDEISMMSATQLDAIDKRLRHMKDDRLPFGGVHVILCGDLAQYAMSTVGSVWKLPAPSRTGGLSGKPNTSNCSGVLASEGLRKWKTYISKGVELTQLVRQNGKSLFGQGLELMKYNQHGADFIALANKHVVPKNSNIQLKRNSVIAVTSHTDRENGNYLCALSRLQSKPIADVNNPGSWEERGIIRIDCSFNKSRSKRDTDLPKQYLKQLRRISEARLNKMSGELYVIIDDAYRITRNLDVTRKIANGTSAYAVNVIFEDNIPDDAIWFEKMDDAGGGVHCVDARYVKGLLMKHANPEYAASHYLPEDEKHKGQKRTDGDDWKFNLEAGMFPVPSKTAALKAKVGTELHEMTVKAFPVVMRAVVTGHSTQGMTLDQLIIASWGRETNNSNGYMYMLLSRVRDPKDLLILDPLPGDMSKYKLRKELMAELDRIREYVCTPTTTKLTGILHPFVQRVESAPSFPVAPVRRRQMPITKEHLNSMREQDVHKRKTADARISYRSYSRYAVGDFLTFRTTKTQNDEYINVRITKIDTAESFSKLMDKTSIACYLPNNGVALSKIKAVEVYHKIPRYKALEKKSGVMGFHFEVIKDQRRFWGKIAYRHTHAHTRIISTLYV
jgi:ASC-1-like (ASCH) protein